MKQNNLFSHNQDDAIYNSEQLKLARLAAGKSLIEVGEALGVTRQYVHKLEAGTSPSDEQIKTLADFLNVQESFFYKSRNRQIELEQCHFRSVRSSTQTLKKTVMSQVEMLDTHFLKLLENGIDFPEIKIPDIGDADISSVNQIELLAEKVRRELSIGLGPISNMTKLLEYIGCLVINIKEVDERVDAFSLYNTRPLVIRNTAKLSPCRLRFDLAHELGHLIMHQGIESGCRKTEEQANNFASAFLMPRTSFSTEFPKMRGRNFNWDALSELKVRWGVSYKAIIYRAAKLGLITQEKAKSGFTYLNRSGQSKNEENDNKILVENPSLVQSAINILDSYTWSKILKDSSIKERIFIDRYMLSLPKPKLTLV
jgi:Zn-dependent peptidase ImmA (M78 family)